MKQSIKILLAAVFAIGCGTTGQVSCPPPTTITLFDTIHETKYTIVDSPVYVNRVIDSPVYIFQDTPILVNTVIDTNNPISVMTVTPNLSGNDYPTVQAALNYQAQHPGTVLKFFATDYYFNHSLLFANMVNRDYQQVQLDIEGPVSAWNSPRCTIFHFRNTTDFGLAVQKCKGCSIKNIYFAGAYSFPNTLNAVQIDTLLFSQWPEPLGSTRSNPYAAIVIDPFSDPAYYTANPGDSMYSSYMPYYISGMSRGGSTAIDIEGCRISNFVVGTMITPSFQQNGEMINLLKCRIDNCKVAYAYTQDQSKTNTIYNLMSWGNCNTIIDGNDYGHLHITPSTAPMVDVMNIAGNNHQLFNINAATFPISMKRIYAEGLFKLGIAMGVAGIHLDDFQIDFQNNNPGVPSPDCYYYGMNTTFTGCQFRIYGSEPQRRIILNFPANQYIGGSLGASPLVNPVQKVSGSYATNPLLIQGATLYYTGLLLNDNTYDSVGSAITTTIHVNADFSGWYLGTGKESKNDLITDNSGIFFMENLFPSIHSAAYPIGFVTSVSNDTVWLSNVGWGIRDGQIIHAWDNKIRN
jgi:hypothetical protein